jgi:uncharacterized protein YlaI
MNGLAIMRSRLKNPPVEYRGICDDCKDEYGDEDVEIRVEGDESCHDFFCDQCDKHIDDENKMWEVE